MTCSLNLESPRPACSTAYYQENDDPKAYLLDGDPACLVFSLDETASLQYSLDCAFTEPVNDTEVSFNYYIQNDKVTIMLLTLIFASLQYLIP
jgi:hypothetical protein